MGPYQGVISQDKANDCTFKVVGSFGDPLSRQLDESVRIGMVMNMGRVLGDTGGSRSVLLNRKDEHYQPRMVLPTFSNLGSML